MSKQISSFRANDSKLFPSTSGLEEMAAQQTGLFVPQMIADWARRTPEALAINSGSRSLSFAELEAAANRLANYLISLGVGPESIVAICLDRSVDFVVAALATLKSGGAYLPLDPAYPRERLSFMLSDAHPAVLIANQSTSGQLPEGSWHLVDLDFEDSAIERFSEAAPPNRSHFEDLAYVIYTSGSTGEPKGVEICNGSLINLISWHQQTFDVSPADRASQFAATGFDASVWETWPYLTAGASLHLPDDETRLSAELLRDWLVNEEITMAFLPTALAERAMSLSWPGRPALRFLLTGADTLHHFPSAKLPFKVVNNYGPTECTVVTTSGIVAAGASSEGLPSIGQPIANAKVYILDEEQRPVAAGAAGELYIGGAGVARGYLNRPRLTAERFIEDPFGQHAEQDRTARLYRTGDLARYLPNGEIAYLGRVDDQIKVMGYRIEPNEIVAVLNRHAAVRESAVVARELNCHEKQLTAYVVPVAEELLIAGDLREFLRAALPEYMVPAIFVRLDSLPVTPNGKIDKSALPPPDEENTLRAETFLGPRTPLEERVAAMLSALLEVKAVSVHDNFFLLGGHSLLGTQLIGQIRSAFGVDLALRSLFDSPTVADLAGEIERLLLARVEAMADDEVQRLLR